MSKDIKAQQRKVNGLKRRLRKEEAILAEMQSEPFVLGKTQSDRVAQLLEYREDGLSFRRIWLMKIGFTDEDFNATITDKFKYPGEYIKGEYYLNDPDPAKAFEALAKKVGVTPEELVEQIRRGMLPGIGNEDPADYASALRALLDYWFEAQRQANRG